ncbi:MAG: radical SAM protein [Nitrospirae bacterium]|nr:MAG: radical SAM protein [Nitrospirota bacterium]
MREISKTNKLLFFDCVPFNIGIASLAAYLNSPDTNLSEMWEIELAIFRCSVDGYEINTEETDKDALVSNILERNPRVVGFSIMSSYFPFFTGIARKIKELAPEVITVCGGVHATIVPEQSFSTGVYDYLIIGDGEEGLRKLLNYIISPEKADIRTIDNLMYRDSVSEEICRNPSVPYHDLDALPVPDYSLYREHIHNTFMMVKFSRGCPYQCTYCSANTLNKAYKKGQKVVRSMSAARAMNVLEHMLRDAPRTKAIWFVDDNFSQSFEFMKEFLGKYKEKVNLPYRVFANPLELDEEKVQLLSRTGCETITIGMQTLNDFVRRDICKRRETNEDIFRLSILANKYKIALYVDLIFGLPTESFEMIEAALPFAAVLQIGRFATFNLVLLPGTQMVDIAVVHGMISPQEKGKVENGDIIGDFSFFGSMKKDNKRYMRLAVMLSMFPLIPVFLRKLMVRLYIYKILPASPLLRNIFYGFYALISNRRIDKGHIIDHLRKIYTHVIHKAMMGVNRSSQNLFKLEFTTAKDGTNNER